MIDFLLQFDVVPFLIALTILVFVHEFGHFQVARWCGVKVDAFSIGFGPELFGWYDRYGTRWKFAAIPLGGYVKMHGDTNAASAPVGLDDAMPEEEKRYSFPHKSLRQRAAIVAAGPASNYAFAVVVMALLFMSYGQPYSPAHVSIVQSESAAMEAGLQEGDVITHIDGRSIAAFSDMQRIVRRSAGVPLTFTINRNGDILDIIIIPNIHEITDNFGDTHKFGLIGVQTTEMEVRRLTVLSAFPEAIKRTVEITSDIFTALYEIITGQRSFKELGGPVKIAQVSGDVAAISFSAFVMFLALLSINLGLINLLPIPALDGGHLVNYFFEWVRGKPLSQKLQEVTAMAGMGFILFLIVMVTWNDLSRFDWSWLPLM